MELRERLNRYAGVQLLRYVVVGGSLSLLYATLTSLIAETTALTPIAASVSAFALSLPAAYFGHFGLTFRRAPVHGQAARFVVAMSNAFVVSTLSMWLAVDVLGVHYAYALVATAAVVAVFNYAVLDRWVFSAAPARIGAAGGKLGAHDD